MVEHAQPGDASRLIVELRRIRATMLPEVGGKAANLGELIWAGLPVPPGFCLTTEAYRSALQPGGSLESDFPDILRGLEAVEPGDLEGLASLAARAREAVLDAGIPADVEDAVRSAYSALGPEAPVAVRSSATAEDLPFASFAGQQDTYLNVVGAGAVLQAVRKCWASLWTDRAVSYRAGNGIDHATVTLAVVVQRMVDAEAAGVLFTANPVTGRRREAVIDANPGLGEAVVSGAVNPDHFVVDSLTGRITERSIGDRKLVIRSIPGGGTEKLDASAQAEGGTAGDACLVDSQIRALAVLGQRVEEHYGAPQDTEWAIDGEGKLWLTQARPITTLYPQMTRQPAVPGPHAYLCFSLAQGLTRPLTPMGLAGIRLMGSSVAGAAGFRVPEPRDGPPPYYEAGQRIYFDLTSAFRSKAGRAIVPRIFDVMEARSAAIMRALFEDPRFAVTNKTPFKVLRHVAPIVLRFRLPEILLRALFRPDVALRKVEGLGEKLKAAHQVPADATPREKLDHAERILREELFPILPNILPPVALGFAMMGLVRKLLGEQASWGELQTIIRGLPNNVTTEMDLALWRLSTSIRDDPASAEAFTGGEAAALAESYRDGGLPAVAQSGLALFLRDYGHRAIAEIDVGMPRWSDDPTHIIGVLVNYLRLDDPRLAPDKQFEKAAHDAEEQLVVLVARARSKSPLHARIVKMALERTRMFAGLRELPKFNLVLGFAVVRAQLSEVGETLAETGVIDDAADVFFLDFNDAHRGLDGEDLHELVAQRREAYELELRRRHVPRVLLSDGTEPEALPAGFLSRETGAQASGAAASGGALSDGMLRGTPASAGTVTAVARVIMDPVGAHLEPGEILVAPSTDPGWTPLFLTAGGLVMEMGGPNSHGAVVAREYGIPAVVGVPDATSRISSGQMITVDGATGTVVI
ncbi:PEP/pyruvate-binding domain-containing protein [Arthrobacter sp. B2a2-09]|uniref:PEP/pyruvate-binding domain-containing protein n=1 Tax=Arthrobacter sp. B2a2-09 TaxID=2952822 RepID=UPI0022CDA752|nr:PEP/pyruvate-binding domain-containing protein [Arthrobacter sp. B2a2-09]MCZ9882233.1 PEP-utilizing enzyme [Arthrobacter sp. B2a2-09]